MVAVGFDDPVRGVQAVFRCLLDALAEPGRPCALPSDLPDGPAGLGSGLYAAALTLADFESPVWLGPELAEAADALRFHTGAPLIETPERAAFALAASGGRLPALADFAQGTDAYPDRSTTVLLRVDRVTTDGPWRLTGPGIAHERRLGVQGVPFDFVGQWAENHARFPRGVDLFLLADTTVVGLPRTTRIEEG